jgi:hypothetical protein
VSEQIERVLTALAGETSELAAADAKTWVVDAVEPGVALLIVGNFRADVSDAHLQHLVGREQAKLD